MAALSKPSGSTRAQRCAWLANYVCAGIVLTGCPATDGPPSTGSAAGQHTGRPATRVASLHDVTTELIVELGQRSRLVGVAGLVDATPALEAAVEGIVPIGDLESIVSVAPTVVFGTEVVAERSPELVRALHARDIEVVLFDLGRLVDLQAAIRSLAGWTASQSRAEQLLERLDHDFARCGAARQADFIRPKVFVYDCCDPPFTAGGGALLTELIRRAGGDPIFAALEHDWTHVSWERVVEAEPDLIVINSYRMDAQKAIEGKRERLRRLPALAGVPVTVISLRLVLGGLASAEGCLELRGAIDAWYAAVPQTGLGRGGAQP